MARNWFEEQWEPEKKRQAELERQGGYPSMSGEDADPAEGLQHKIPWRRLVFFLCVLALAALCWWTLKFVMLEDYVTLDRINLYEVTVEPQRNGKMLIHYYLEWEVLDSFWDGPLTWVQIGVDNDDCQVVSFGGSVADASLDGTYVNLNLDRRYRKGEVAIIELTVLQGKILAGNISSLPGYSSYSSLHSMRDSHYTASFTPCWFEDSEVLQYTFRWQETGGEQSQPSDAVLRQGYYVWEGSLAAGKRQAMRVVYDSSAFAAPSLKQASSSLFQAYSGYNSYDGRSGWFSKGITPLHVWGILGIVLMGWMLMMVGQHLDDGSGSHHHWDSGSYGGGSGGGGGSSGSGCACASSCAGGGRAGCAAKGFVHENPYSALFATLAEEQQEP